MMSRRLCASFFGGAAASRSRRTACCAAPSVAHTILALFSRRLQSPRAVIDGKVVQSLYTSDARRCAKV